MSRKSIMVGLIGVNLALLVALVFTTAKLPAAQAQPGGAVGGYAMITNRIDTNTDALFLLDATAQRLHAFVPDRRQGGRLNYVNYRNLKPDFTPPK
ncbi:MAG: hypothetical protein IH988_00070 [Planctomycetes bacterium]|nr:hypothetical protein [Planctomycetota bacterium]